MSRSGGALVVWLLVAVLTAGCDAKKEAVEAPSASSSPSVSSSPSAALPEMAAFETKTPDKFKTRVAFRAPKETKGEGRRFTWKTMLIDVFAPFSPATSNDNIVGAAPKALLAGAEVVDANAGERLISYWFHPDGAGGAVCAIKGKKPMLIVSFEPGGEQAVALAICRSLEVGD